MPLYEYRCDSCRETFERLQKASEDSSGELCEACGKGRLVRIFSKLGNVCGSGDSCSPSGAEFT